jgi:LacI family transcriptional regulator, galactose operon repressor
VAVFAFCDIDAANVLDACANVGLAVPDEVAILGTDNNELICESVRVPLSSVNHDLEGVGYEGAALLQRLMQEARPPKNVKLIPPKAITIRQSTEVLAINHEPTRRALQFLQENYRKRIGAEEVATVCGMSRRKLDQSFHRHLGRTVSDQLATLRLIRAKELLLRTNLSAADVAAETGFNTPQYFNNVFRRATGLTPRRFRLEHEK